MQPRGIGMISVIAITSVLALMVGIVAQQATFHLRHVSGEDWKERAYYTAYAGIQYACYQLQEDPTVNGNLTTTTPIGFPLDPDARFSVYLANNLTGDRVIEAHDGTQVAVGKVYVRSDGTYANQGQDACIQLRAMVELSRPVFKHALFADSQVKLSEGAHLRFSGSNNPTNRLIGTNSNEVNPKSISVNSAQIDGDVDVGAGANTPTDCVELVSTNLNSGQIHSLGSPQVLASFAVPQGVTQANQDLTVNNSPLAAPSGGVYGAGNLRLSGTVMISPGTYFVNDTLTIDQAELVVDSADANSNVFIYARNNIEIRNSRINNLGDSRRVQMFVLGKDLPDQGRLGNLTIEENSELSAVFAGWGLEAVVEGASELKGAIQARIIEQKGGATVVYDNDLFHRVLGDPNSTLLGGYVFNVLPANNPVLTAAPILTPMGTTYTTATMPASPTQTQSF